MIPIPYDSLTTRTDAGALIPEDVFKSMLGKATTESATLELFRRVPVARKQTRVPVMSALPIAYWVNGDTGLKQTTEMAWANKFINIEEIATIMPIPDNVVADVDVNIWDEAEPYLVEAVGRCLDATVFFGVNAPSTFPTDVVAAATAAGNSFTEAKTAAQGGFLGDLDAMYDLVEADGFDVTGFIAARTARGKLRSARDTTGQKIDGTRVGGNLATIDGLPIAYPMRGLWPAGGGAGTNVRLIGIDRDQFVVGVRNDVTMKILDQAVIQDNTGAIVFNLAQQDMTAVRLTFRVGWQVANTINNDQAVEANRYPAGVLRF